MQKETYPVELFTEVAPKYEFLNSLMTAGQDRKWRDALLRAAHAALGEAPLSVLDLACGTGDVARLTASRWPGAQVTATDPNEAMLGEARKRAEEAKKKNPQWQRIIWSLGRAEKIDCEDNHFDLITIAFGFRNVPALERSRALAEALRVLRPGGVLAILELGLPPKGAFHWIYKQMLVHVMPHFAGLFSPKQPYLYLSKSIVDFPLPEQVKQLFLQEGFLPFAPKPLSGGMAWVFIGRKPI
jgi:demethylmenaquinone methyltransferase/2-methoxy-6-polyprenyl-1,4-benzoquinol methylase